MRSSQASQASNAPQSTYLSFQALFGTQAMLGPSWLVKTYFGAQMDFVLESGELITLVAQISSFAFVSDL